MFLKYNPRMRESDLRELKGAPLSVYIAIASHMDWGARSFPSLETLSRETGYSVKKVKKAMHFLRKRGFISPVRTTIGHSTVYQVNHWFSIGRDGKGEFLDETKEINSLYEEKISPHKKNKENKEEDKGDIDISISSTSRSSSGGKKFPHGEGTNFPSEDKNASDIWEKVKARVKEEVARGNYKTWIKDTKGLRFSDSTLVISAPNNFVREHIELLLYPILLKKTAEVLGREVKLEFQTS